MTASTYVSALQSAFGATPTAMQQLAIGQRTIREGWFYRFMGSPPAGTPSWETAAQFVFIPQTAESLAGFEASLTFALHFVPTAAAIDYFSQGKYGEGAISAAGDLLLFAKVGTRLFFAAKEAGMADDAAKALVRQTATKYGVALSRADAMIEGIIGGYRIKGAIDAAINGDSSDAAGKAGEALLRLLGAKTSLSELRKLRSLDSVAGSIGKHIEAGEYVGELSELTNALRGIQGRGSSWLNKVAYAADANSDMFHLLNDADFAVERLKRGLSDSYQAFFDTGEVFLSRARGDRILRDLVHEGTHFVDFFRGGIFRQGLCAVDDIRNMLRWPTVDGRGIP